MKRQGYGRVLCVSSAAGAFGNPLQAGYAAAKAGLLGLMNVLSLEGKPHGVLCNALLPVADSRMAAAMDPKQLEDAYALYSALGENLGSSYLPEFITPLVTYLASEACSSTHGIYSAALGRYAKAFIGVADGWIGPRDKPASPDELAECFEQVVDLSRFSIPKNLLDEFSIIAGNMPKGH